jgi:hypothetical protein
MTADPGRTPTPPVRPRAEPDDHDEPHDRELRRIAVLWRLDALRRRDPGSANRVSRP